MPAFVKTDKDETRWSEAKKAVERSKGKSESDFHDRDWALTNYIYHKMGKSEADLKKADELKNSLISPPDKASAKPKKTSTTIKSPMKVGSTAVKMPKSKAMASPFAKPSLFFKSEDLQQAKHPSVCKLRDFLMNRKARP